MEEVVTRCMAMDPEQRLRSMDEVLVALKRVGGGSLTQTISGVSAGPGDARGSMPSMPAATAGASGGYGVSRGDSGSIQSPLLLPSDSPPPGGNLASQPPGKSGSKGVLVGAMVGALALAGVMGYVALSAGKTGGAGTGAASATQASTTTAPPATTTATTAAPTQTAAAPLQATVRVNTDPDGATVKEDGVELCSSTPCDVVYKGADADGAKEHKIVVAHQGYRQETRSIKVSDTPVTVKLTKADGPHWVPPPKPDNPPAVPTGYKTDIPY
jgi:serine/threonine-protein kinase